MEEYLIYEDMAEELLSQNINQAYLCYENAWFLCEYADRRNEIRMKLGALAANADMRVRKTCIAIVSYNSCYLMQRCIEAIRNECIPDSYEIVVVDNASTDGVRDWLCGQDDIKTVLLEENVGFPMGCNIAVQYAGTGYDVFLLNNDTRLTHNALFWLRMGLYSSDDIGATGSIANYAGNRQQVEVEFTLPAEYVEYAGSINVPMDEPFEERVRLSGFSMLIRRELWDELGGMDEAFSPGYFEDDDLSVRILWSGYRLLLCKNSFIYHAGSQSFSGREDINELLIGHMKLFEQKYGFNILEYADGNSDLPGSINFGRETAFNLCHIGCGLGAQLKLLRGYFPNANLVGVDKNPALFEIVSKTELVFNSIEDMCGYLEGGIFHVMLISGEDYEALEAKELELLKRVICEDGIVLIL